MDLRIDPDTLLDTARTLQRRARWVAETPLPAGPDPAIARARHAAATVVADVADLVDRLVRLVHDLARHEEAVARDCSRLGGRTRS